MNRSMLGSLLLIAALLLSSCTVVLPVAEELITPPDQPVDAVKIEPAEPVAEAYPAPEGEAYPLTEPGLPVTLAMANEQLSALGAAMIQAGLLDILLTGGPYTILAPTDEAFAALDDETVAALSADQDRLATFLQFHVIEGVYALADLQGMEAVENLAGAPLAIVSDEEGLRLDQARIVVSDISVPNGIVHVVDAILFPFEGEDIVDLVEREASLGALASLLELTGLDLLLHAVGPFTLLAPTDQAFADFFAENPLAVEDTETLAALLQYHVVPAQVILDDTLEIATYETWLGAPVTFADDDGVATVEGAAIVLANIEVTNGAIHLIDRVLVPPEGAMPVARPELMDMIEQLGGLQVLAQVVGLEALEEQLAGLESFTLFVPTEEAFKALSDEVILELVADPEALGRLLQYHVAPQTLLAADLAALTETLTLAGLPLSFEAAPLTVNGAGFVATDILLEGGVVHLIDAVLLPPEAVEAEAEEVVAEKAAVEEQPEAQEADATEAAKVDDKAAAAEEAEEEVAEPGEAEAPLALASQQLSLVGMLRAMVASGLLDELEQIGPITIFGPSDVALNHLPQAQVLALAGDPLALRELLEQHIVPGTLTGRDLAPGPLETISGAELTLVVDPDNGALTVNGARILWVDMRIGDAVIHIIDQVLLPAEAEEPVAIEPEKVKAEEPAIKEVEEAAEVEPLLDLGNTLAGVLRREPRAELLASLVELANLNEMLSGEGPLMLLAPTDVALSAVPSAVLLSIARQEGGLVKLLSQHVISGSLTIDELAEVASLTTQAGHPLAVSVEKEVLLFGGATVVDVIEAENGTLYLIDSLLLNPDIPLDVVGQLYAEGEFSEFLRLLDMAGMTDALSRDKRVTLLAPTDEAFAELSEAQMEALTEDLEALATWLGRYVLPRRITAEELTRLRSVESYSGDRLLVRARRGNLFIGGTRVIQRNIGAANGLIHAVDTVVLPKP